VYAGSDIVALTSLNEGTPVSLIEAQVAGKPIVTTNAGGVSDILEEGKTAFIVPCNDNDAFSMRLLELVEDDSLRNRMSGGASSITMERFDYRHLISNTTNLYHRLLHR
jgi:glycosyltransferase involved in cell wall biosynthesis